MNLEDFDLIARLVHERSGLVLSRDKAYLVESRLNPVARRHRFKGVEALARAVRQDRDEALITEVTEAMTTNESSFFRDGRPFQQFRELVLPRLLARRARAECLRIWSAACAAGQEPYSLAMVLAEHAALLEGWDVEILATDLSREVLAKAEAGCYSQFEVQRGLPIDLLVRHFTQDHDRWQLDEDLRAMVSFQPFNLLDDPAGLGSFDVVFCRNVLIYFDEATKTRVLEGLAKRVADDGFLFLGGTESLLGLTDAFQAVPGQRGVYGPARGEAEALAAAVG